MTDSEPTKESTMRYPAQRTIALSMATLTLCLTALTRAADEEWWPYGEKRENSAAAATLDPAPLTPKVKAQTSYASIINKAAPGVVSIFTSKTVGAGAHPFHNHPMFRELYSEGPNIPRKEQGLGSGVIVTSDGYIITNNHVVEGADEINVAMINPRREYKARMIGSDPDTDIAVLKIDADNLPAVTLADSDLVEIGDMVFAIGNAFGVGQTVTSGIVSAIGRGIGIVHYEDFIQTNAEINPGNSGGALIDPTGRLVGINTAILSRSGGNQGIGFAIPANLARYIVQQVLTEGRVVRGFLGVHIEDLTANLQQAFKMENLNGALVNEVLPNSAASEAGVQRGDIIVGFNDIDVRDSRHLMLVVARTAPNTETNMTVIRDGAKKVFQIVLKERPDPEHARHSPVAVEDDDDLLRGVTVDDITAENRRSMDIPSSLKGAVIVDIETASPAFQAGLRKGDVVQEVDWKQVADADEAIDISKDVEGADSVLVYIWRRGTKRFVVVEEIAQ